MSDSIYISSNDENLPLLEVGRAVVLKGIPFPMIFRLLPGLARRIHPLIFPMLSLIGEDCAADAATSLAKIKESHFRSKASRAGIESARRANLAHPFLSVL